MACADCEKPDGSLSFEVLPIDENRAAVRDVARQLLNLLGVLWLADPVRVSLMRVGLPEPYP